MRTNKPLCHPWRTCIAVGRAYDLMRADLRDHLARLQREMGYRYCRFHAVFHDDMKVVTRRPDGSLRFHWHHLDKVYDFLLSIGLKPLVELNPMPAALASGKQTMFYYRMNVTPPRDWSEWGRLVETFARHLVSRYGLDEVRQWLFEVWNEPNLDAFWAGSKEDYFRLYEESARALKRVDGAFRVGGPASSKGHWVIDLVEHCCRRGIPLDFVSTHLYPQDEFVEFPDRKGSPHAAGDFFIDTVRRIRRELAASPRPDLPIYWTEWNTQSAASSATVTWGDNIYVDNCHAAALVVRNCLALDEACDALTWWVASDIFEEGPIPSAPFSCTYGMMTIHGIPKASMNAFRFLRRLTGPRVDIELPPCPPGAGAVATVDGGVLHLLAWHAQLDFAAPPPAPWQAQLTLPQPFAQSRLAIVEIIRPGQGSPYEAWVAMGKPENLLPAEEEFLRRCAQPYTERLDPADRGGRLNIALGPGEVGLWTIVAPEELSSVEGRRADLGDEWKAWEAGMSGKSRD